MAPGLPAALASPPGDPTTNSKWRVDIDTAYDGTNGATVTTVWDQLRGMSDFTPALDNTIQDASDYDTGLWGADAVTGRKWKGEATCLRKEYDGTEAGTVAYDKAQEFLRVAADEGRRVHVRWYERSDASGEAYEGIALVQWDPQGGAPNGLSQVKITLLGQGPRIAVAVPTGTP